MKLEQQRKMGVIFMIAGVLLGVAGWLWDGDLAEFLGSFSSALVVMGAVYLVRSARLLADPERAEDYEAAMADERTGYLTNKARSLTLEVSIYAELAGSLLASLLFKEKAVGQILCYLACGQSLLYLGLFRYYQKKY